MAIHDAGMFTVKKTNRLKILQDVIDRNLRPGQAAEMLSASSGNTAGCTFDDIVDVTTFHTDPEQQLNDVMAVKQEIFAHPPYPNWTAVGVTWLASFDFEIKVIARIP